MKRTLATIIATAATTTVVNYKYSVWKYNKAEAHFKESANRVGNFMYALGKIHGAVAAQQKMHHARPVIEETKYVSHTMN